MKFFDSIAHFLINFVSGTWQFLKHLAGTIVNSTFGWYTGKPIDEGMAAALVYGALVFILVVYLFFGRALKFNK